jgi:hypothetical protein
MEKITDTIQRVFKEWEVQRQQPQNNPEALLKSILSKKELGHVRVKYFKKGVLALSADSSSWLYHLGLQKEDILSRLRQKTAAIQEVRFCLGEANAKGENKTG